MRFGLVYDFRNPAAWRKPWPEVYAALLDQIAFADELGFDSSLLDMCDPAPARSP